MKKKSQRKIEENFYCFKRFCDIPRDKHKHIEDGKEIDYSVLKKMSIVRKERHSGKAWFYKFWSSLIHKNI